jgi:hypothetical protein
MPCDLRRKFNQTQEQRNEELKEIIDRIAQRLVAGTITPVIGTQGGVAFQGLSEEDRGGATDICIYRRLMVEGGALALHRIQQAEMLAGRTVDRQAIAQGWHSHDGGKTWGRH